MLSKIYVETRKATEEFIGLGNFSIFYAVFSLKRKKKKKS